MDKIKYKIAVMSGKGGVGKSAVTVNLSALLAMRGYRVGIADADLNGPSVAKMTGVRGIKLDASEDGILPATGYYGMKVMSMDMLLPFDETLLHGMAHRLPMPGWDSGDGNGQGAPD